LSKGISYSLPSGSAQPISLAYAPSGLYLATANLHSNNLSVFTVVGGVLINGTSYTLPAGSLAPYALAFWVYTMDRTLLLLTIIQAM
jgi:hypothetical protein